MEKPSFDIKSMIAELPETLDAIQLDALLCTIIVTYADNGHEAQELVQRMVVKLARYYQTECMCTACRAQRAARAN